MVFKDPKCNGIFALNLRLPVFFKNRAYLDFMYEGSITEELKDWQIYWQEKSSVLMINNKRERIFYLIDRSRVLPN